MITGKGAHGGYTGTTGSKKTKSETKTITRYRHYQKKISTAKKTGRKPYSITGDTSKAVKPRVSHSRRRGGTRRSSSQTKQTKSNQATMKRYSDFQKKIDKGNVPKLYRPKPQKAKKGGIFSSIKKGFGKIVNKVINSFSAVFKDGWKKTINGRYGFDITLGVEATKNIVKGEGKVSAEVTTKGVNLNTHGAMYNFGKFSLEVGGHGLDSDGNIHQNILKGSVKNRNFVASASMGWSPNRAKKDFMGDLKLGLSIGAGVLIGGITPKFNPGIIPAN